MMAGPGEVEIWEEVLVWRINGELVVDVLRVEDDDVLKVTFTGHEAAVYLMEREAEKQ